MVVGAGMAGSPHAAAAATARRRSVFTARRRRGGVPAEGIWPRCGAYARYGRYARTHALVPRTGRAGGAGQNRRPCLHIDVGSCPRAPAPSAPFKRRHREFGGAVDLGASLITGFDGNPLTNLVRRCSGCRLSASRASRPAGQTDTVPRAHDRGRLCHLSPRWAGASQGAHGGDVQLLTAAQPVDPQIDRRVETDWNKMLAGTNHLRASGQFARRRRRLRPEMAEVFCSVLTCRAYSPKTGCYI